VSNLKFGLAIETSSRVGSVALVDDGQVLTGETFEHGLQHAARIVPAIDELCRQFGKTAGDIAEIYVSAGPGSFTGLRIGITLAKTLAFATGAAVVAVPSVRVLVENAPDEAGNVMIVLDAKRDQIFTARFEWQEGNWIERDPARLDSLANVLSQSPRPVYLLGEGIPYHQKFIPANDPQIHILDSVLWRPRAECVAKIGWQIARSGGFCDVLKLVPIYIRRPEAEEKFEAKTTKP
jgi:tRNA threonylcarbamoyladenosine biosynthesis protein TsaB